MSISDNQSRLFWVATKKLGISERGVRDILTEIAGVESVNDLDNDGFSAVMGFFEFCGFKPLTSKGADYGKRPGMASYGQIAFIRTLWWEYTAHKAGEDELNKWLLNNWHISSLRFLTAETAPKVPPGRISNGACFPADRHPRISPIPAHRARTNTAPKSCC